MTGSAPEAGRVGAQLCSKRLPAGKRLLGEGDHLGVWSGSCPAAGRPACSGGGEARDGLGVGAAPAVDRLVGVGHRHQVAALAGERLDEAGLDRVHVVQLVDEDPAEKPRRAARAHAGARQQTRGQHEQVGVVEPMARLRSA